MPTIKDETITNLQQAISLYGTTISPHNGGLTNINPVYSPPIEPIEPHLPYLISNGWYIAFEPYTSGPPLEPPFTTNGSDYDYWHWAPDEILDLTNLSITNAGVKITNGIQYAYTSLSNSFTDMAGWGLTNGTPKQWVCPYFNATREGSFKIQEQLGIKITGDTKLGPFPHWTVSTQTPDKYYSFLQIPVSDWFISTQIGTQIAQSIENGHTATTIHALVDFYYNMGALINLYCHSTSDGLGMDGPLPGDYVTYSLSKPRVWSTNSAGIYSWWLQRSNAQVTATFTNIGNQSVTTLSIHGESNTNAAVELLAPSASFSSLQVTTNGVLAGASAYRTNGQVIKVLVGTTVTNAVVSYAIPPAAQDDSFIAQQATPLAVPAPGVLTNDTTGTGAGTLTAALVSGPANGTLTFNTNGSFTYTPTNGYTGMDSFTYRAVSGSATSSVAIATIAVVPPGELFYDNFARSTSTNSIFPWVNAMGAWSVTNSQLVGSSPFSSYGYAYYAGNWTNFSVQAQIQFSSTNRWGGSIGGRVNPATGAHYALWVLPEFSPGSTNGTPVLQLIKYENWIDFTLIADQVPLPPVGTSAHTVKLTFQGNSIAVYFDGTLNY